MNTLPDKIRIYDYSAHTNIILSQYVGQPYYIDWPHFGGIAIHPGDYVSHDNSVVRSARWAQRNHAIWKSARTS